MPSGVYGFRPGGYDQIFALKGLLHDECPASVATTVIASHLKSRVYDDLPNGSKRRGWRQRQRLERLYGRFPETKATSGAFFSTATAVIPNLKACHTRKNEGSRQLLSSKSSCTQAYRSTGTRAFPHFL